MMVYYNLMNMNAKKTLVLVDIQNDFLKGGVLAVPRADEIISGINSVLPDYDFVFATLDYHPAKHVSFVSQHTEKKVGDVITLADGSTQILWPDHCVQGTYGAELSSKLDKKYITATVKKGEDKEVDSYSAFFDMKRKDKTELDVLLRKYSIEQIDICGLATEFCVYYTVLDALFLGYHTSVLVDLCRAANIKADDGKRALRSLQEKGAILKRG